ncbi:transcription factor SFP1 [Entomortierella parvispora]|uniref:Transcription factor SFP1 n=1 Tax=Entomortierella parvispora TaxID=205924 RepID=A0A9P3HC37_9FUNG|nr:transcription factor SFP1 [Entomortierella parvispora]
MPAPVEIHSPRLLRPQSSYGTPLLHQHPYLSAAFEIDGDFERLRSPSLSYAASSIATPPAAAISDNLRCREFETAFCRDFFCCGLTLLDLHDLLQHYEECHVHFEDEKDDESIPSSALGGMDLLKETSGQDAEFLDDDSWSDTESNCSQPSSTESLKGNLRRRFSRNSSGDIQEVTAAALRLKLLAAVKGAEALTPSHSEHALSQMHTSLSSFTMPQMHRGDPDSVSKSDNITAHAVDALGFGMSNKRKTMVSLADIYTDLNENDKDDVQSSAFPNTILRSLTSAAASELLGPLAKRQALESNQRSIAAAILSDKNGGVHPFFQFGPSLTTPIHPSNLFPGSTRSISPLSTNHVHRPSLLYHSLAPLSVPATTSDVTHRNSPSPYVTAAVDLMRQREEVFSILEDMTKPPPNSSSENKPYRCSVLGCDKAYKNPNGLKYHNLHGHCSNGLNDQEGPESKPYVCTFLECGKSRD